MNQKKKELEQNELAGLLDTKLESLKPHMNLIGLVALAIFLVIVAVAFLIYNNQRSKGGRWSNYMESRFKSQQRGDTNALNEVVNLHGGTIVEPFARMMAGDIQTQVGTAVAFRDKEESRIKLEDAKRNYQQVVSAASVDPMLKRRALYGLANVNERLGEFSEAKKYYQQLLDEAPSSVVGKLAADAVKRVSDSSVTSIFDEYLQWDPNEEAPTDLPPRPQISFPDMDG